MIKRNIEKTTKSPLHPGFLGEGHFAAAVVDGKDFTRTDPFIFLMDDQLDLPGKEPVGGPHPHAGFETITLVIEGDGWGWKLGSLELMTAGKGVIHTEEITSETKLRILQFWLVLPPEKRWTKPVWQQMLLENVPTVKNEKAELRVYSGSSNGLTSPLKNETPFILTDVNLKANAEVSQKLPSNYNGYVFVIEGNIQVGDKTINTGELGWLNKQNGTDESEIIFQTNSENARFVFFAAKPHQAQIYYHGPFIGNDFQDIQRLFQEYRQGKIPHLNDLPEESKIYHGKTQVKSA